MTLPIDFVAKPLRTRVEADVQRRGAAGVGGALTVLEHALPQCLLHALLCAPIGQLTLHHATPMVVGALCGGAAVVGGVRSQSLYATCSAFLLIARVLLMLVVPRAFFPLLILLL